MMSKYFSLCFTVVTLVLVHDALSEIYSSMAHVEDELFKRRQDTSISALKQLLDSQEQRLVGIKRIVQTLDDLEYGVRDPTFSVRHPLDAYRFIKNHSMIYRDAVKDLVTEMQMYKIEQVQIEKISSNLTALPTEDLLGTLEGILRIQYVYDLKTNDIADGNIRNKTTKQMSAAECQDMATVAFIMMLTHLGREWLYEAGERVMAGDNTTSYSKILSKGAAVAFRMGDEYEAVRLYQILLEIYPKDRYKQYKLKYYNRNSQMKSMVEYPFMDQEFLETCRGITQKRTYPGSGKLFCRYLDNRHPLLRYQPAKLEVLSIDPYICVFHDFFNKKYLSDLKNDNRPYPDISPMSDLSAIWGFLEKHDVMDDFEPRQKDFHNPPFCANTGYEVPSNRLCETYDFIYPDKQRVFQNMLTDIHAIFIIFVGVTPIVEKLYKYIEAVTSLRWVFNFENLQMANYGIGGHYDRHFDVKKRGVENDRIATLMIYLSDVEEGGATAFPAAGEYVLPEEGKAVFWYNLYPNGKCNFDTRHSACPVIFGDKWVANIWIHSFGQEFTRPCNLEENDTRWKL